MVEAVGRTIPLDFDEVFIDGDDDLELRYGLRVPVVEVAGEEAFEFTVDAEDLPSWSAAATAADRPACSRRSLCAIVHRARAALLSSGEGPFRGHGAVLGGAGFPP